MKPRLRAVGALAALALLALAACGDGSGTAEEPTSGAPEEVTPPDDAPAGQPEPVALADAAHLADHLAAVEALAIGLLQSADQDTLVVSPASVAATLVLLGAGAQGETLAEIEELLGADIDGLVESVQALRADLAELDEEPDAIELDPLPAHAIVHLAGHVVVQEGVVPEQDWLDTVGYRLGAGLTTTDVPGMQQVLDDWVALHTAGLVEESAITAGEDVRLVVQDAVLVASAWLTGFDEDRTTDDDFTLATGEVVPVPTMHAVQALPYTEVDGHRGVQLELLDGLALQVVLPAEGTAPADLGVRQWTSLGEELATGRLTEVTLALPRADVASEVDLTHALAPLGLTALFGPGADLTGILADGGHHVDQAVQQTRLQIGEDGVVAAAVTEMAVGTSAVAPPPDSAELVVDRPYAVRVVDAASGWVLFHGVIGDPREA